MRWFVIAKCEYALAIYTQITRQVLGIGSFNQIWLDTCKETGSHWFSLSFVQSVRRCQCNHLLDKFSVRRAASLHSASTWNQSQTSAVLRFGAKICKESVMIHNNIYVSIRFWHFDADSRIFLVTACACQVETGPRWSRQSEEKDSASKQISGQGPNGPSGQVPVRWPTACGVCRWQRCWASGLAALR